MKHKLFFNFFMSLATSNTQGKTYRNLLPLVVIFMLGLNGVVGQETIISWDFTTNNNPNTNLPNGTTTLSFNTGGTIGTSGCTATGFSSNGWHVNEYLQIVAPTTGYTITSLSFIAKSSNTGPWNFKFQYSSTGIDGTFLDLGTTFQSTNSSICASYSADFSGINSLHNNSNTVIRIVFTGGEADGTPSTGDASGTGTFRLDDLVITGIANATTYTTFWSNSTPTASIDAIIDGNLTTSADLTCKDLTINSGKTLTIGVGKKLTVSGNLINNGTIIFKSDVNGSAIFDVFNGTQSGTGLVTTERYIPAKRAFRFLSPSVTTTTTIKENWQENAGTTPGLGTHISGDSGATNGFDTTTTNNPSLFTFNPTTALWEASSNTNTNTLTAGTAYRILVRGDRTTDLSSNTASASTTILRASGTLKTGSFSPTLNQAAEGFSFVGNPYQAPVDIKAVLNAATNMNTGLVYYWDPTLNTRGGYVTRNLSANTNDVTSNFTEILQSGQAVFVKKSNTATAASMSFIESNKSVANAAAGVFKTTTNNDYGMLRVNLQATMNNQLQTIEGAVAIFNSDFNTAVTEEDATKMTNLDEEVSFVQNNTSLAIACQPNPTITSELPIRLNNTRHTNYQWQFDIANYSGPTPFLVDTQNNSVTQITNTMVVPFTANTNANRFKIVFQNAALNLKSFSTQLAIYPNPAKAGESFYIDGISEANVTIFNVLGQNIQVQTKSEENSVQVTPNASLSKGVYLVTITSEGNTQQVKWIVE